MWARIDGLPFDGSSSGDRNAGRSEAAAPSGTVPHEYGLSQNFPNPFNPSTIIRYAIPLKSHVLLTVHNLLGQVVATVVNQDQEAGFHEVRFDAVNLSSGVYLYRLEAGKFVETRKLTLLK
ncbi:MAG TPA: T9SS type A sorting domain-containing protein [Bacteroidota bacterium]|nr:T9SS type A sorting domain-containing protein [Bacteroidota bacterium]